MSNFLANKKMNLAGTTYAKGEAVPSQVIDDISPLRLESLKRTRLIIEVETAPKPSGDLCPHCNEGPFQRLAQHVSLKHEDILLAEETDDSQEEE